MLDDALREGRGQRAEKNTARYRHAVGQTVEGTSSGRSQTPQHMFAFLRRLVTTTDCDKAQQLTIHNDTCWMRLVLLRASKPAERQKKRRRGRDQCEPRQPHALEAPPYAPGSSSAPQPPLQSGSTMSPRPPAWANEASACTPALIHFSPFRSDLSSLRFSTAGGRNLRVVCRGGPHNPRRDRRSGGGQKRPTLGAPARGETSRAWGDV